MDPGRMIEAHALPGGAPPGIDPRALVVPSSDLAEWLGMSAAAMDRLTRRHRRELRSYGPVIDGPPCAVHDGAGKVGTLYLSLDQRLLLTIVSETGAGAAERARLLTLDAMAVDGIDARDPRAPTFGMPGEVRRWAEGLRHGAKLQTRSEREDAV